MGIREEIFGGFEERKKRLLPQKAPKKAETTALTDIVVRREEVRRTDMRHEDRPLLSNAIFDVTFRGEVHQVGIINLSGGGAMLAAPLDAIIGERVDLTLAEGDTVECIIRWVKNGRWGVEFANETKLECTDEKRNAVLRDALCHFPAADDIDMLPLARDPAETRAADRHPLIWSGELRFGSFCLAARLRNISATGAMVECPAPVRVGTDAILDLGNAGSIKASIRWAVGDYAGLHFAEPFDVEDLSRCRPRVTAPTWLRPSYLESEQSTDSDWNGPWNQMSLHELREQLEGFLKR